MKDWIVITTICAGLAYMLVSTVAENAPLAEAGLIKVCFDHLENCSDATDHEDFSAKFVPAE